MGFDELTARALNLFQELNALPQDRRERKDAVKAFHANHPELVQRVAAIVPALSKDESLGTDLSEPLHKASRKVFETRAPSPGLAGWVTRLGEPEPPDWLPADGWFLRFQFELARPVITKGESDLVDNEFRRDRAFETPLFPATSWKGSLRRAYAVTAGAASAEEDQLFGPRKPVASEDAEDGLPGSYQGELQFYSTQFAIFGHVALHPSERITKTGKPLFFQVVPEKSKGLFALGYYPLPGRSAIAGRKHLAVAIQAMFRDLGFGAKTTSGFGMATESVENALLKVADRTWEPGPLTWDRFESWMESPW